MDVKKIEKEIKTSEEVIELLKCFKDDRPLRQGVVLQISFELGKVFAFKEVLKTLKKKKPKTRRGRA